MAGIISKVKDYLFTEEREEPMPDTEDVDFQVIEEQHPEPKRSSKVVNINNAPNAITSAGGAMKMILFQPLAYEDSQAIVDNLRSRKPVIVNMVDLERDCAQRVIDFISGAAYALGGTIRKVSFGIFVIVPSNVSIVGNSEE